jgi:iron complex outermembrane receptor protein
LGRGYKAGGFNPLAPPGFESYDQESSWNYELGAKSAWLDDRLSLRVALFYIDWDDLQLNQSLGVPGQFYIANAGGADSKGVELEVQGRPLRGWDLFGGVGYTDARFLSGATASHIDASGAESTVDVGGNHLIYTPEFTANAGTQYSLQVCTYATLYARAEVVVYGRYFYNAANTAFQDAYSLANFRAGVRARHWFAEGWVRNAFDTEYVPIAFEFPNGALGGSGFVAENGAPLTFGLRAGVTF